MIEGSVLIVGSGPSGLAAAIALGKQGVKARIVDSASGPAESSRALAVQARSLEIFDLWGIVDDVTSRGLPMHGVRLYGEDKRLLVQMRLGELPTRYPYMLSLPQSETEKVLIDHVKELGFNIERDTELTDIDFDSEGCMVKLQKSNGEQEEARFQWVIGCDGAHSTVRRLSHAEFEGKEYPQQFLLADVRINWPLAPNEAHIFTAPEGILACFPMPGGYYRVVANKPKGETEPAPDIDEVRRLMTTRGPKEFQVDDLKWSSNFFIHARLVESMQRGRVFLVGDAAHIHSPALGQGMNTGIQDAANLGWKLALVVKGLASEALLESYSNERWPVERGVLSQTDFTTRVMDGENRFFAWLRDLIAPVILANKRVSAHVRELVSELAVGYTDSPIVLPYKGDLPFKPGERLPDATVTKNGHDIRLYELLRDPGHHLLLMADQWTDPQVTAIFNGEMTVHSIRRKTSDEALVLQDSKGEIVSLFGWDCACLIRPDGYVGAVSGIADVGSMLEEYSRKIHVIPTAMRSKASLM